MKSDAYELTMMLKVLLVTGDHLQKHRFEAKKLNTFTQECKLKMLNTTDTKTNAQLRNFIIRLINDDLDKLLLLKMLYWVNCKDALDQRNENRSIINTLLCTYYNLTTSVKSFNKTDKSYVLTLIIQNIYQYYKLNYLLKVNVEKTSRDG